MFELTPDKLVRLRADTEIAEFDCGDDDLNEFLAVDAQQYLAQLLTVTYLVMDCDKLAAFFSLSNDKLTCAPDDTGAKKVWNRIQRRIPNIKRRRSYPAVKIGRLGVCETMQGGGVGQQILDWLKILFLTANRTGCRFITVDAYDAPKTIHFYKANWFTFLSESDEGEDTRQMYFDLKPFADLMTAEGYTPADIRPESIGS
jgi:GNAT superfamily N-acetyltransferase